MIRYEVTPVSPESHLYEVMISICLASPDSLTLKLPAWARGSYMIRDFARNIITLDVTNEDISVAVEKLDKQTWQTAVCFGQVIIRYRVYAWDLSVRASHLDITHAYFNGSSLLLAVGGHESDECVLEIHPATGEAYRKWQVATSMPVDSVNETGFGTYKLPDYEALIDHPVEMGEFDELIFTCENIPHRLVVSGRHDGDLQRLLNDLEKICGEHVAIFGELPLDQYLFLLWIVGDGYGGLEHRNSTSLLSSRGDLPSFGMQGITEGYRRLLGLCSHEYFHLWNVKRIMPEVFSNNDLSNEVYTRQLWVFEGVTSYYDELALVRCGVIDRKNYFELLAETITRVQRGSGRLKQTLEESSFDAWTKFYKQDENAPNAIVSYYAKGALFALVLDLHVRLETESKKSLDDIMRGMWLKYGRPGIGVPERAFEHVAEEITGLDLAELFEMGVRTTNELPLAEYLANFGVIMRLLPARSATDKGQFVTQLPDETTAKPVLGAKTTTSNGQLLLQQVYDGSAAQVCGLSAGDEIIAIDGLRMNEQQIEQYIAGRPAGEKVIIHAFRRDELMEFTAMPKQAPNDTCLICLPDDLDSAILQRLNCWLHHDSEQSAAA